MSKQQDKTQTFAPKLENFIDMPFPNPVPPPVTKTTLRII